MASERHQDLRKIWFAGRTDIQPLPTGHVEIYALGRVPSHVYPLEVETPFTNQVAEQHCFVRNVYSGIYSINEALLALHLEDWELYFPRIHTTLIILPQVDWGLVVPTDTDTTTEQHEEIQYAPLTYSNLTEFLEEIQNMVMPFFNWREDSSENDISDVLTLQNPQ
jgi:hypothetical protein